MGLTDWILISHDSILEETLNLLSPKNEEISYKEFLTTDNDSIQVKYTKINHTIEVWQNQISGEIRRDENFETLENRNLLPNEFELINIEG